VLFVQLLCQLSPTTLPVYGSVIADPTTDFWDRVAETLAPFFGHSVTQASAALDNLVRLSKADGTRKLYERQILRFADWKCDSGIVTDSKVLVTAYLAYLASSNTSISVLESSRAALKWFFGLRTGDALAVDSPLGGAIAAGVRRQAPAVVHRSKMTREDLLLIASFCFREGASLADWRFATICILGFSMYLRVGEISRILRADLTIDNNCVKVLIRRSKADQEGQGEIAIAARSGSFLCPAATVEFWLAKAPLSIYVFPNFSSPTDFMSEDYIRKEFKRVCLAADISVLTPHSLRGGGATLAIAEGIPQAAVKSAGRWKSDSAFSAYVEKSLKTLQGAGNLL
jgi:integrase